MSKTRTVAGRSITLIVGRTYLASRPIAEYSEVRVYDKSEMKVSGAKGAPYAVILTSGRDDANALLLAFNRDGFSGRVW